MGRQAAKGVGGQCGWCLKRLIAYRAWSTAPKESGCYDWKDAASKIARIDI